MPLGTGPLTYDEPVKPESNLTSRMSFDRVKAYEHNG